MSIKWNVLIPALLLTTLSVYYVNTQPSTFNGTAALVTTVEAAALKNPTPPIPLEPPIAAVNPEESSIPSETPVVESNPSEPFTPPPTPTTPPDEAETAPEFVPEPEAPSPPPEELPPEDSPPTAEPPTQEESPSPEEPPPTETPSAPSDSTQQEVPPPVESPAQEESTPAESSEASDLPAPQPLECDLYNLVGSYTSDQGIPVDIQFVDGFYHIALQGISDSHRTITEDSPPDGDQLSLSITLKTLPLTVSLQRTGDGTLIVAAYMPGSTAPMLSATAIKN